MSYMASGILGVVAGSLALGAVHLEVAAGNDLLGPMQRGDARLMETTVSSQVANATPNVNRSLKGDRANATQPAEGITISFRVQGVDDTTIMMRVPVGDASDIGKEPAKPAKKPNTIGNGSSGPVKRQIACEPVVSVLTQVSKQLQPGRCVT